MMGRFTGTFNAADQARLRKRAERVSGCAHNFKRYSGNALFWEPPADCFGFKVGPDAQYHVESCSACGYRRDVSADGEVLREYDRPHTPENVYVEATADPGVYVPRNDGIDAFNESDDSDKRDPLFTNLFDTRGGSGGIGDESE